ncbi:MAG TPA: NAD-dependent epimerase/dehydratase family protein [Dissulfurispiraceae bacterium]|nr:NAD-dependent epimerase/dehydratase family protein [Dissulfurispiraceae bacterium]
MGSHIVQFHLSRGHKVHVVDDLSTGSEQNIRDFLSIPNFHFEQANLLSWPNLQRSVAQADRIYHMAAVVGVFRVLKNPVDVLAVNVEATELLLKAAHKNTWRSTLIVASTSEVYGNGIPGSEVREFSENDPLLIEENSSLRWNYPISKLIDEAFCMSYAKAYGAPIIAVRFFNTIGPRQTGQYGMVVPRFVRQAISGQPITVFGDGSQKRCFCDVRDTVVMLDLLAKNIDSHGEVVNVGNAQEISIFELAERVKYLSHSQSEIRAVPYQEAYGMDFADIMNRRPSMTKLLSLTDMQFQWPLNQTLLDLIYRAKDERKTQEG